MVKKYLIIGLIVTLGIGLLLIIWQRKSPAVFAPPNISISKQQQAVASIETGFLQQIDIVNNHQVMLTGQIKNIKAVLEKAKIKGQLLKGQVQNHYKELVNTDSNAFLAHSGADNISQTIDSLFVVQASVDSIQQDLTQKMEEQVLQKQTVIQLQQQQYISLKTAFNQSIAIQNSLSLQNKQFKKWLTKQKIKKSAFAIAIVSAATLFVKQALK